jgi:hypothetical protein
LLFYVNLCILGAEEGKENGNGRTYSQDAVKKRIGLWDRGDEQVSERRESELFWTVRMLPTRYTLFRPTPHQLVTFRTPISLAYAP